MKKKFKFLACALLLVFILPCMFLLTGCGGSSYTKISSKEYAKLLFDSGTKYYETHNGYAEFGNMTISTTFHITEEAEEEVEYKKNASDTEYVTENFTVKVVGTSEETITIYNVGEGDDAELYAQVTTISNFVTTGYRASETDETLEAYTETTTENSTYTFVKDGEEYRWYGVSTEKVDDEETVEKQYFTYATSDDYENDVSRLLYDINDSIINIAFYSGNDIELGMTDYYSTYYQDGKKFRSIIEFATTTFVFDAPLYTYLKMDSRFADNMPNQVESNMEYWEDSVKIQETAKTTISYTANTVSKPADTTGYELATSAPVVSIFGLGIGGQ